MQIAKYAYKTLGAKGTSKGVQLTVRAMSRMAGDMVAGTAMLTTTGSPRVMNDAVTRMMGDASYEIGEDGGVSYAGHEGGLDVGKAWRQAAGAQWIEYWSEMVGNAGVGKLLTTIPFVKTGVGKVSATGFGKMIGRMNKSHSVQYMRALESRAQWSGLFPEFGEEKIR